MLPREANSSCRRQTWSSAMFLLHCPLLHVKYGSLSHRVGMACCSEAMVTTCTGHQQAQGDWAGQALHWGTGQGRHMSAPLGLRAVFWWEGLHMLTGLPGGTATPAEPRTAGTLLWVRSWAHI